MSTISRSQRLALPVALIAALLLLVPAAFAAKGGGGGKPSGGGSTSGITGPTMVYDANSSGTPNWGDEIAFTTSTSWTLYPSIEVTCSQNGTAVYRQSVGYYPTYIGSPYFTLSGYWWTGGAASCTAALYYTAKNGTRTTLATTSFAVAG